MSKIDNTVLLDAVGRPITIGRIVPEGDNSFTHDPERPTHTDLEQFARWRRTKCQFRNLSDPVQRMEEIDQATHEFVGEVAELIEMLAIDPLAPFMEGRDKLKDEIGDIFFCGSWLGDAIGHNLLIESLPTAEDLLAPGRCEGLERARRKLIDGTLSGNEGTALGIEVIALGLAMSSQAGLLCNAYKKARWQRRPQPLDVQVRRINVVLSVAAEFLYLAGFAVADSLARNVEKLDTRFPVGYQGPGGGIRTGKGA